MVLIFVRIILISVKLFAANDNISTLLNIESSVKFHFSDMRSIF